MVSAPLRILLIDDLEDWETKNLLRDLDSTSFALNCVHSCAAGQQTLIEQVHDVCLLNMHTYQKGLDFLQEVLALGCRGPVVLLADEEDPSLEIEAIRAGAADLLTKRPLDIRLLERSLRFAVARHQAATDARQHAQETLEAQLAELTQANAALTEAERRKDDFMAMLAHELRNPLAALAAAVELVQIHEDDPANRERIVGVLQRQVQQLCHLVDDLLDVARIMRGKIRLHKQPVDLRVIVAQAVENARPILNAHKHLLHVSMPDVPLPVEADTTRLTQVFANLLNNAAKFTKAGGSIWVTGEEAKASSRTPGHGDEDESPAPEVLIHIRDNGIGMAEEVVPRVFDLFVQANTAPNHADEGLGIGLTLVRRLVRLHGGSISARSDGLGRGSEFVVRLPLFSSAAPGAPAPTEGRMKAIPVHRLLLVDDNVDMTVTLARLLRHLGQEVRTAHDGPGALAAALAFRPEIILLDIGLPGSSGYEVATTMRSQPGMENVRLIALTGFNQEEERTRCKEAGFHYFLTKPVGLKTLTKILAEPSSQEMMELQSEHAAPASEFNPHK